MTEAEMIYHRHVHYEWNDVSKSLKNSIIHAIEVALIRDEGL